MARETETSGSRRRQEDRQEDRARTQSGAQSGAQSGQDQADQEQPDQDQADQEQDQDQDQADGRGDGFAALRGHHKALRALLGECAGVADAEKAEAVLPRLAEAWARHAGAHRLLYDAAAEAGLQEFPLLTENAVEADLVSFLLGRAGRDLDGPLALAGLRVAARMIGGIVEREEKPRSGLLAKAKAAGVEPAALGRRIRACMTALSGQDGAATPQPRHLTANQEDIMPRNSNMPERDERGRFVSDDDDRHGSRGRGSGRGASGRDDDRERDSRGRFVSDDDDRRYASSRRYDDDRRSASRGRDDDYGRDRGQGGWFGDPEGHAEAARRGWDHRRDDDDDRYGSRGRGSGRGASGEDDDRERDSRGRFVSDDDDRRYASSRRYDDDRRSASRGRDDDYGRDRGQGGWFGDPEGHAEAARRGWDHRRDDDDDRYGSRGRGASGRGASGRDDDDRERDSRGRFVSDDDD
ncbi:MAG: hypothetical protein D1H97_02630, partial [Paracoccus sp. BP8]